MARLQVTGVLFRVVAPPATGVRGTSRGVQLQIEDDGQYETVATFDGFWLNDLIRVATDMETHIGEECREIARAHCAKEDI